MNGAGSEAELRLDGFLPFRLSVVSNIVSETIASAYRRLFAISIPEWRLVAVIAESDGLGQSAIGLRTRMDKVTVSRAAAGLAARGLIERSADPRDGRARLLRLTAAGRALYEEIAPKALALEREMMSPLDVGEIDALRLSLARIEAAALALGDAAG